MVNEQSDSVLIADLIAKFLEDKKIDTVFGIIGSANAYIFDSIMKRGYTKIVYMHHEQAVVMAAGAYYRASGKMSAAIVTAGGGASNAVTGVVTNWADSIPCLIFSGQESTKYVKEHSHLRMLGTQGFDVVKMVSGVVKYGKTVMDKKDVVYTLEEAYHISLSDRPGPVWIDFPFDIQSQKIQHHEITHFVENSKIVENCEIEKVIDLLNSSERPVILGGHGIKLSSSKTEFNQLVELVKIPTMVTWAGLDLMAYDHPYNFGIFGLYGQRRANFVVQNSDLIIVLGSRLAITQTGYNINNFAPNAKIIIVNNDENELNKHDRYNLKIKANVKNFINELYNTKQSFERNDWYAKCCEFRTKYPTIEKHHLSDNEMYDNSYVTVDKLSDYIEDDSVIVFEQGTPIACGHQAFKAKKNQIIFASTGLGEMGNGLPSAIGAAFANPGKTIYLLMSDGSLMMNLQELQTVVGYRLPIKIIMFNNEGYLFIKHTQKMLFSGRYTGVNTETGVSLPELYKICNAFGIPYYCEELTTLENFIKIEYNPKGPCVYETFMNPEQDLSPKVKGIVTDTGIIPPPIEEMSPLLSLEEVKTNMIAGLNPISYSIKR